MGDVVADLPDFPDEVLARMNLTRAQWDAQRAQHSVREARAPNVGDAAPDFELPVLGGDGEVVRLSSFRERQPVALVFGSYT
jgi:hypothetical protein